MILCSWLYGVWVCSIFVFPELYLCVALIYDGRENMSSFVWVAMINQGVKFILFYIIALWLVSWWSAKGKDDKMELYVVCSLILYHDDPPRNIYFSALKHIHALAYIMMISQGKMSRRGYMETAPWFVSQWSTKDEFSSLKYKCSLTRITMISQGVFCCF